nr:ethanolamine ammonia-lyase reactivating factor EutA [Cohnella algarum]
MLYGESNTEGVAVYISGPAYFGYEDTVALADALAAAYIRRFGKVGILIVLCELDMAKALGHALSSRCPDGPQIICIDQVDGSRGDYLDLGMPLAGGLAIPVTVKTLLFHDLPKGGSL